MSTLDVEALLDATANSAKAAVADADSSRGDRSDRKRDRDDSRDRDRDRKRRERDRSSGRSRRETPDDRAGTPRSDTGSHPSGGGRRRSRSRDDDYHRRGGRRHRGRGGDDDYYHRRGGRSRSRSPNRYYRPRDDRRDRDYRRRDRDDDRRGSGTPKRDGTPSLGEDERDRRTVFVQQLAARLRTRELKEFFEKIGPVTEAQIVKDRVSGRSKGVGYVEFKDKESVTAALQLTGQKLLGIPVIVQLTEAEKNRQTRNPEGGSGTGHPNSVPFHRLYVGNIHFNITEEDLRNVFQPFGALEFVQLQKDDTGRSRGYGFVQFRDATQAREALEKMNGFDLAGRPIRVGLGNDKFTPESTANLLQKFQGQNGHGQGHGHYQGSSYSGGGGRGQGGGSVANFDRAGGRDADRGAGASALDDTDVAGVNFNNYSRDALMRKLARTDEPPAPAAGPGPAARELERQQMLKPKTDIKPLPINMSAMASRCVVLHNMFDPAEEEGEDWAKEMEDEVRQEAEQRYGHVVHISLDPNSQGDIYLKFDKVQGGENAIKGLNGRYFGGRMISAAPVIDAVYSSLFSRAKAI